MTRSKLNFTILTGLLLLAGLVLSHNAYAATTLTVNVATDLSDADLNDGVCDTDLGTAGGQCSLRAAIQQLNALGPDAVPHHIHFNIPGAGPHVITPLAELPWIQVPVVIDGETQPGAACPAAGAPADLKIVLDGVNLPSATGFWLHLGSDGSTLRGLVIGNFAKGMEIVSNDNRVECNHIGVAVDGVTGMGNGDSGLTLSSGSDNNIIGGESSHSQRNVISGNAGEGIFFSGNENILVANNYIGTTADGLSPLGNSVGVFVIGADNTLGGTSPLAGNVIGGNGTGVYLLDSQNSRVWGNLIGLGADSVTPMPNSDHGVRVGHTTTANLIGGLAAGEPNVIAHNGKVGIYVQTGAGEQNALRGNRIFANGSLGIELGDNGVDVNDPGDADAGPNLHQNYPVLASATDLAISGTLDSAPGQTYELDFYRSPACDPSGHGEGETYLGTTAVTTDGSGQAGFTYDVSGNVSPGEGLSATATDPLGNTSEFSACVLAEAAAPPTPTPTPDGPGVVHLPVVRKDIATPPPTGMLVNSGTVVGIDGVGIGAYGTTLASPLEVTILATSPPGTPLSDGAQALTGYYDLRAAGDTSVSPEAPLVLAFPVPAGAPTGNLALGVLLPAEGYLDGEGSELAWQYLEGQYDQAQNLFLTTIPFLAQEGRTFVLVEHPEITSPPSHNLAGASQTAQVDLFHVECRGFYGAPECPASAVSEAESKLEALYWAFDAMNYPEPRLKNLAGELKWPPDTDYLSSLGYSAYLERANSARCSNIFGYYLPESGHLALCSANLTGGIPEYSPEHIVLVHEYFHALEFAFEDVWDDFQAGNGEFWIAEGLAAAAQDSYFAGEMKRSTWWNLRPVDVPIESRTDTYEYKTQDFFVYHAQGLTISYLKTLLGLGAQSGDIATIVDGCFPACQAMEEYWNWAKNQVMVEDEVNFDGALGARCTFQPDVVVDLKNWIVGGLPYEDTLSPLTTHVVKIEFPANYEGTTRYISADAVPDDPDLLSKVYMDGEAGCENVPDGSRSLANVSSAKSYYVVISNTHVDDGKNYRIIWD